MDTINQLKEILAELRVADDPRRTADLWAEAKRLFKRTRADTLRAAQVCAGRDVDSLASLIERAEALAAEPEPDKTARRAASAGQGMPITRTAPMPRKPVDNTPYAPTDQDLRMAMKAFRKRLKLTRLDDESSIGGRQLTGGRQSQVDAIMPPSQFRKEVWVTLAEQGRLRHTGQGFYVLCD